MSSEGKLKDFGRFLTKMQDMNDAFDILYENRKKILYFSLKTVAFQWEIGYNTGKCVNVSIARSFPVMTIKDLSARTGYSVGTVSRVLNEQPNVREKARKAILDAARECGFQLNTNAQQLKKQHTNAILVVVKDISNQLFARVLEVIQARIARTDHPLFIDYLAVDDNEVLHAQRLIREKKPIGVLFLGGNRENFQHDFDKIDLPCPGEIRPGSQARYIEEKDNTTQWKLEGSTDGERWFVIKDKSDAVTDLSHDLIVREEGFAARYLRLSELAVPYGQNPCVSGLRVFGLGSSAVTHFNESFLWPWLRQWYSSV